MTTAPSGRQPAPMPAGTAQPQLVTIVSRDGTSIGLWKTGTGPSLLAVHGAAADHGAWEKMVPLLADAFTVYTMDRRGRGASGDATPYSIEREFEDVAAAADALPGPVHLYGHSFGGICVLEAATPTRNLGRLAIYEGGPKPPGLRVAPDELIERFEHLIEAGRRDEALSEFMLTAAGVTQDELPLLRQSTAWPGRVAAAHTIPRELRAINDLDSDLTKFASIDAPTLVIVGGQTEARRREMFEGVARLLPRSRVTVLPGQRHAAHQTAPELLASALREFLGA